MATAQGKITTSKLTPGMEILVSRATDGTLRIATKRTGSIIAKVMGEGTSHVARQHHITTDQGSFHAAGNQTHFLATDRDRKRVEREAASAAQAQDDSATVLAGVTPIRPEVADKVTTEGTVRRNRRTLPARHIRTGDTVRVEFQPRDGAEWLPASKTVAATFARKLGAPVFTSPTVETPRPHTPAKAAAKAPTYRDPQNARKNFAALAEITTGKVHAFWVRKLREVEDAA